jgi:hypothetical protein
MFGIGEARNSKNIDNERKTFETYVYRTLLVAAYSKFGFQLRGSVYTRIKPC